MEDNFLTSGDKTGPLCRCILEIPFKSKYQAKVACDSLSVDPEPPRSTVTKKLSVNNCSLKVEFVADQTRAIRASVNNFLDLIVLVENTIQKFGQCDENDGNK